MYALPLTPVPVSAGSKAPTAEFESSEIGLLTHFSTLQQVSTKDKKINSKRNRLVAGKLSPL